MSIVNASLSFFIAVLLKFAFCVMAKFSNLVNILIDFEYGTEYCLFAYWLYWHLRVSNAINQTLYKTRMIHRRKCARLHKCNLFSDFAWIKCSRSDRSYNLQTNKLARCGDKRWYAICTHVWVGKRRNLLKTHSNSNCTSIVIDFTIFNTGYCIYIQLITNSRE